jgi:hypothetical protein
MSNVITGEVTAVSNKGKATNIQIDRSDWYGCGFVTPDKLKFTKGDKISFTYTENGQYKNVDLRSVEVQKGTAAPTASSAGPNHSNSTNWDLKNAQDAERQRAISVQSCRNSAIEVVKILKELDALPLGSKKQDIAGNLEKYIDDLTERYYNDTQVVAAGKSRAAVVQSEEGDF